MSTFDKFKKAVREAYLEKQCQEQLPDKLNNPSPANLREYSSVRLVQGLSHDDLSIFKDYFNPLDKHANLETAIKKADLAQLKSIQNFILNITVNPSEKIVKMVAILIDFPKRPYKSADWIEANISGDLDKSNLYEGDDIAQPIKQEGELGILKDMVLHINEGGEKDCEETVIYPEGEITREEESVNPLIHERNVDGKTINVTDATCTLVGNQAIDKDSPIIKDQEKYSNGDNGKTEDIPLSGDNSFRIKNFHGPSNEGNKLSHTDGSTGAEITADFHNSMKNNFFMPNRRTSYFSAVAVIIAIIIGVCYWANKECMCWNGIRYIKVNCRDKTQPNQIIGLNEDKLNNFEKIMQPDTLSKADVGKVWYSKIDNEVEFFTHPGYHPIQTQKSLKAATEHIIKTYSGNKNLD